MRNGFAALIVAVALGAAAPAWAQRQSLADRVAVLEQQAANSQANNDLLNQLNQLRTEVTELRSLIEQLQHENQQLKQSARDQYLDLDGRLSRIEGGVVPVSGAPAPVAAPAAKSSVPATSAGKPAAASGNERQPSVYGDSGTLAQGDGERTAYNAAFDALKAGKYADSAQLFQGFLDTYPNGVYAPNAMYWLGESYYVTRNFPLAEGQFRSLVDRYPTHDKASGGLLKLGLTQYGEGRVDAAEATLSEVVAKYPNTDAARTAADRLQSIRVGRLR